MLASMQYYTVRDKVSKEFGPMFPAANKEHAERVMKHSLNKEVPPENHKDFELVYVLTISMDNLEIIDRTEPRRADE